MTTLISGTAGVTFPAGGLGNPAGAVVGTTDTQTLTNKTLTSPTLTTPNIDSAQIATVSGTAPLYMCRAWVNFNGTGVVAIRASGNVTSITDNQVGDYTINFTTAISDANYAVTGSIRNTQIYGAIQSGAPVIAQSTAPTTTALRITTPTMGDNNIRANIDSDYVSITIFR